MDYYIASGVKNLGNTCYMSSALQMFLRFIPFTDALRDAKQIIEEQRKTEDVPTTIFDILDDYRIHFETNDRPIDPTALATFLDINVKIQDDITSFMANMINKVFESAPGNTKSIFQDIFLSKLCFNSERELDSSIFLTIPVAEYTPVDETISNMLSANSQSFLYCPPLLFVQINRLSYVDGSLVKDSSQMLLTPKLDLTSFNGGYYSIYAVAVHRGSSTSGHYNAYIHDQEGWLFANDSLVETEADESRVLSICSDSKSPAYVIAYVLDERHIATMRTRHTKCVTVDLRIFNPRTMTVKSKQREAEDLDHVPNVVNELMMTRQLFRVTYGSEGSSTFYKSDYERSPRIIVWAQPKDYPQVTPNQFYSADQTAVTFQLAGSKFTFELVFHPAQQLSDFSSYVERFLRERLLMSRARVDEIFLVMPDGNVKISTYCDMTLFEFSLMPLQKPTFIFNLRGECHTEISKATLDIPVFKHGKDVKHVTLDYGFDDTVSSLTRALNREIGFGANYVILDDHTLRPLSMGKRAVNIVLEKMSIRAEKDYAKSEILHIVGLDEPQRIRIELRRYESCSNTERRVQSILELPVPPRIVVDSGGAETPYDDLEKTLPLSVPYTVKCYVTE